MPSLLVRHVKVGYGYLRGSLCGLGGALIVPAPL
jgi:hypothetical protein